jgi:hypothetical protein
MMKDMESLHKAELALDHLQVRRIISVRITGFLDFVHHPEFQILENNILESGSVYIFR